MAQSSRSNARGLREPRRNVSSNGMQMRLDWLIGAVALLSMANAQGGESRGGSLAAEPRYLMFQLFTAGPAVTTEPGKHVISKLPEPGFLAAQSKEILDTVGERGDDHHRLGVIVGPLALDYTDSQMSMLIERTFAIASKYKLAVGLHIDESKLWTN